MKAGNSWTVGALTLGAADLAPIAAEDYDGDGSVEAVSLELDGLAAKGATVSVSYTTDPLTVLGFSVG